jgi:hypothetical protein
MSKFIKYENLDFRINNDIFYSTSVEISLQSSIEPVLLSDGCGFNAKLMFQKKK